MMDEYDDYDYDDDEDEVADLWNGRLPMDRVLQTLQSEIEERQQTQAQLAAAVARAEAAEAEVAALRAQLAEREWRPVTEGPETEGFYLVYDADGTEFWRMGIFPYRVAKWYGRWDSGLEGLVDYWQPLPTPPGDVPPPIDRTHLRRDPARGG